MKKSNKLTGCLILFGLLLCSAMSAANRPEEMKTLAEMLRGTWAGTIEQQENKTLEMWGSWILDGHFVELELITKENKNIVFMEKFIFGWDSKAQTYSCRYFNSSGETGISSWWKKDESTIVQKDKTNHFIKLQQQGGKLLFNFKGRKMALLLRNR